MCQRGVMYSLHHSTADLPGLKDAVSLYIATALRDAFISMNTLTQTQKEKWTAKKAPDASTSSMSLSKRFLSSVMKRNSCYLLLSNDGCGHF